MAHPASRKKTGPRRRRNRKTLSEIILKITQKSVFSQKRKGMKQGVKLMDSGTVLSRLPRRKRLWSGSVSVCPEENWKCWNPGF
jgi:hypothetical protein